MHYQVVAVSANPSHSFSKNAAPQITLLAGAGVEGDAHCGATVKHRARVAQNPSQPNLRQVHLIHAELFDELAAKGFSVSPGQLGENITTLGLNLLALPVDTELRVGASAIIRLTGLRNPCVQLDQFQAGLMSEVLERTAEGMLIRKAGVMGVVICGGPVRAGDAIEVKLPAQPHRALEPV
jgi:MOSC domain-containing protein YiiM